MQTVAVGTRWDAAGAPLPEITPMPERGAMGAELWLHRDLYVDPEHDPLVVLVDERVGEARWLSAMSARYDRRLADTYLRGAGELAARASGSDAERRAWGARSMLAELACGLRLPETTLARRLARTTMLAAFPRLVRAAESGQVPSWHCDAMLDVFTGVTDGDVLARADAALIGTALAGTAPQLRAAARRWRARHVPRTDEQRRANLSARRVDVTPADDDLCFLTALVPAAQALAIDQRLEDLAAAVADAGDERTRQQVRADALCDLLLSPGGFTFAPDDGTDEPDDAADASDEKVAHDWADDPAEIEAPNDRHSGGALPGWVLGVRPELVVTVPVLSLLGQSDEPAELEGFGPIDLDTARMLAAHAPSFTRVLTHPETGAVLSVGRHRYRIPDDLKRAVRLRDRTCRFPGCRRRARTCDIDHSRAWAHGGTSDACNLVSP